MSSLENRYKNLLNKNEEDSYFSYLSKKGIKSDEKYYDALSKADTEHRLSSSDYGARAESLSSSGLNGSGYEDYLKSRSDKSYLGKIKSAELSRSINEYENKSGYERYLSDYEAMQSKISESVIKEFGAGSDFSIEKAFEQAVRAGVSRDLAYFTARSAVDKAKETTMKKAIQFAKINGLSAKKAKEYALGLGLDNYYAEEVYKQISVLTDKEKNFYSKMTASDYYDYVKSQSNK